MKNSFTVSVSVGVEPMPINFLRVMTEAEKFYSRFPLEEAIFLSNQFIRACGWSLKDYDCALIKWIDQNWN